LGRWGAPSLPILIEDATANEVARLDVDAEDALLARRAAIALASDLATTERRLRVVREWRVAGRVISHLAHFATP